MRDDKVRRTGNERAAAAARVDVHPAADKAARGMMTSMAAEFDRWMADEIEELAESIHVASDAMGSPDVTGYLHQLAEQLARQADMLGYADVAQIAKRLSSTFDPQSAETPADASAIDMQIAELRALMKR